MEQEIWKDIEGYERMYQVSCRGRVKSLARRVNTGVAYRDQVDKILNPKKTIGYHKIVLSKNCKTRQPFIHRLVGIAFLPNPENKPQVNHLNGIRNDNRVENLEWCTGSENSQHALRTGLKRRRYGKDWHKSKIVLNTETGIFYDSAKEAASVLGCDSSTLVNKLCGRRNNYTSFIYV